MFSSILRKLIDINPPLRVSKERHTPARAGTLNGMLQQTGSAKVFVSGPALSFLSTNEWSAEILPACPAFNRDR
jgi:hypothetical protein